MVKTWGGVVKCNLFLVALSLASLSVFAQPRSDSEICGPSTDPADERIAACTRAIVSGELERIAVALNGLRQRRIRGTGTAHALHSLRALPGSANSAPLRRSCATLSRSFFGSDSQSCAMRIAWCVNWTRSAIVYPLVARATDALSEEPRGISFSVRTTAPSNITRRNHSSHVHL